MGNKDQLPRCERKGCGQPATEIVDKTYFVCWKHKTEVEKALRDSRLRGGRA